MSDYFSWEDLENEDELHAKKQSDSSLLQPTKKKLDFDELPVSHEFKKLLDKKKTLENKLKRLTGEASDISPEQARQEAMFKVQTRTAESILEDKRLAKITELKKIQQKRFQEERYLAEKKEAVNQEKLRQYRQNQSLKTKAKRLAHEMAVSRLGLNFDEVRLRSRKLGGRILQLGSNNNERDLLRDIQVKRSKNKGKEKTKKERKDLQLKLEQFALENLPSKYRQYHKVGQKKLTQIYGEVQKMKRLFQEIKKIEKEMDEDIDMPDMSSSSLDGLQEKKGLVLKKRSLQRRLKVAMEEDKKEEQRTDLQKAQIIARTLQDAWESVRNELVSNKLAEKKSENQWEQKRQQKKTDDIFTKRDQQRMNKRDNQRFS